MKIVHLCLSAFYIDNYSYQENILPKYHVKMGYNVTVIASLVSFDQNGVPCYLDGYSEYEDKNGFHVVRLPYKSPVRLNCLLRRYKYFEKILSREAPDIIFSHNISFSDVRVLVRYLRAHPNVQVFGDNHGDYINSAKSLLSKYLLHKVIWRYYAKMLEPYLTRCYGVTPMRCRFLREMYGIDSSKIAFLPMGVDDECIPENRKQVRDAIRKKIGVSDDSILVLTGGKIDRKKNTHILISALQKLNDNRVHLVICGTITPDMDYLESVFDTNPNIHYQGWCNAKEVMECMMASDFVCFPGTHSTLWEQSVGVGLPAIFKRWNEMEHVNINGNCDFVSGDDDEELKSMIRKYTDKYYYNKKREKAQEAASYFLYSEIARKAISDV